MSYGSSKVSSSGSSSFLSGSSSGRSVGSSSSGRSVGSTPSSSSNPSSSGSSCVCDFLIEVDLLTADSFVFFVTNRADCDLVITSVTYAGGGPVSMGIGLPATVAANGGILSFPASETFDVRGLTVDVGTDHCGTAPFEIPIA